MKLFEEMMTTAAGPGMGDSGEAFKPSRPIARRGKFAGQETFIVKSEVFNSLKQAKKKGKHWRKFLGEDDAYHDLREYARKQKGPIVVEDERTGACMYVRYGKSGIYEAYENSIDTGDRGWLSDAGKDARNVRGDVRNNYGKDKYLGKFKGMYVRKTTHGEGDAAYHLQDPKTKKITHSVNGEERRGVLKVGGASSTGDSSIKMHDFYHHLLKHHVKALVGTDHSEGAKKVWQKLAKKRGVSLHGWHKGKAVNLDPGDESETHGPRPPSRSGWDSEKDTRSPEEKTAADTKLVASFHQKGAKRIVRKKK